MNPSHRGLTVICACLCTKQALTTKQFRRFLGNTFQHADNYFSLLVIIISVRSSFATHFTTSRFSPFQFLQLVLNIMPPPHALPCLLKVQKVRFPTMSTYHLYITYKRRSHLANIAKKRSARATGVVYSLTDGIVFD